MIIVDRALQERERIGRPVRVGMIGAGAMGRAITNQIVNAVPGMRLVAISNRHPDAARHAYAEAGVEDVATVDSVAALERAIAAGRPAVTDDPSLLCAAGPIDAHGHLRSDGRMDDCILDQIAQRVFERMGIGADQHRLRRRKQADRPLLRYRPGSHRRRHRG